MAVIIGATGVNLPPPQALFPQTIAGQPGLVATNRLTLAPGEDILLPPGKFMVSPGQLSQVQIFDPVTLTWNPYTTMTLNEAVFVESDGVNYRVMNPTGFPIGAVVTASGTGFTSAPTVTPPTGQGSTWTAIVGGALSTIVAATAGSGTGYFAPPVINIAAPPAPGVPATATCTISGGVVTTITIVNPGAGYTSAPAIVVVPQAGDLNFFSTTNTTATKNAVLTASLSFAGNVTAVLMNNEGSQQINVGAPLTFAGGGGSGAAAQMIPMLTIQSIAVTTGGSGYPASVGITTFGGSLFAQTSGASQMFNNIVQSGLLIPRQAQIAAVQGSGSGVGILNTSAAVINSSIIDSGLFTAVPTAYAVPAPVGVSGSPLTVNTVFSLTMGGNQDTVYIQPT